MCVATLGPWLTLPALWAPWGCHSCVVRGWNVGCCQQSCFSPSPGPWEGSLVLRFSVHLLFQNPRSQKTALPLRERAEALWELTHLLLSLPAPKSGLPPALTGCLPSPSQAQPSQPMPPSDPSPSSSAWGQGLLLSCPALPPLPSRYCLPPAHH